MRDDRLRLERIVDMGEKLLDVVDKRGITAEELLSDTETRWLVSTPLLAIGEQTNKVSQELVDSHADIPWLQVAGLRHRLVHDYEGTNWSIIAAVLFGDLRPFVDQVKGVLDDLPVED